MRICDGFYRKRLRRFILPSLPFVVRVLFLVVRLGFREAPVIVSVYQRRPCAGRRLLFFVLPKKSNQKKGARITQDLPVPWPAEWHSPKCPRQ
ncbi:hypothetical protein C6P77_13205 [Burkholderia ambifaria]|nr:hypothetical protein C6P77_13205 [Burkholderia ambifaria]